MKQKIGKSQTPTKSSLEMSKVLRDSDLYLNPNGVEKDQPSQIKIDLRLPSTQLFQDNMLSMLRLVNYHPFSGVLKVQDVTKNDLSIHDLPTAVKNGTISRTS